MSFAVKGEFSFEPINNKKQLEKIINQKFKELGNKTWAELFRQKLENVKNKLDSQNREPGALFLTGGASRMGFIQNVCEELFPNTKFVRDSQPEIPISRGLALWGKTDYKVAGFLEKVEEFLEKYLPEVIQINILSFEDSLREVLCEKMHKFIRSYILAASIPNFVFMGDEEKNYKKL
ncbi:MAG: hypothetical protein MGG11_23150 [Trichodesmium sp. MAG_R03]|nr:hypothetical protein [Trichodesmium sp. MAG_R03]